MRQFFFYLSLGLMGGYCYGLVEVLFRGYTHWSMFLLGGLCFIGMGWLRRALRQAPLAEKMLLCGLMITTAELLCGLIVNRLFDMNVWDYSAEPLNLWGQICLPFTAAWCVISLPAMGLDRVICNFAWQLGKR